MPVSGFVSAKLHVGGRPDRPELGGEINLADVSVRGVRLGAGQLTLSPTPVGPNRVPGVAVHGRLFDRFDIDAQAALGPKGPHIHGELDFRHVEIEALAPELVAFGDARGIISGRVTVDIDPGRPLALEVLLPELWLSVARAVEGAHGETTIRRVRVEAARPLHVSMSGDRIVLDEAYLKTDGGNLVVQGRLDGKRISGLLSGHLDLELVQPFLGAASPLERLSGDLSVELKAGGTLDKPELRGKMAIASAVRLRPKDFDRDVVIGSGSFALDEKGVAIQNLAITIDGSTMRLGGRAELGPGFVPQNIQADVDGDVSARLLAFVAPDAVSDAQGKAHVRALVRGTLAKPEIRGRLDLGAIDFRLRDMGTEVQVQSGIVEISNEGVILHNVRVVLDDQGILVIGQSGVRAGRVQFTNLIPFKPGQFDLPLHGEKLTYRSAETFEVDDLAFDLDLNGNLEEGFELAGEVRLVSGRYLQDFKVQDLVISRRVNESSVRPFYEGKPLLEDLALDLSRAHGRRGLRRPEQHRARDPRRHPAARRRHAVRAAAGGRRPADGRPLQHPVHARRLRAGPERQPRDVHRHQVGGRRRHAGAEHRGDEPGHRFERRRPQRAHDDPGPGARGAHRADQRRRAGSQPVGDAAADRARGLAVARDAEPDRRGQRRHRRRRRGPGDARHGRQPDGALHRRQLLSADRLQPAPDRGLGRIPGARPQAHHPLLQLSDRLPAGVLQQQPLDDDAGHLGFRLRIGRLCAWSRSERRRRWACRRRSRSP